VAKSWPLTLLAYHSRPLAGRILSRLRSRAIARNVFPWLRHSTMSVNTSGAGRASCPPAEVLEDHIRLHLLASEKSLAPPHELAEDLIDPVRAYLK
jgi:hypothetical protein